MMTPVYARWVRPRRTRIGLSLPSVFSAAAGGAARASMSGGCCSCSAAKVLVVAAVLLLAGNLAFTRSGQGMVSYTPASSFVTDGSMGRPAIESIQAERERKLAQAPAQQQAAVQAASPQQSSAAAAQPSQTVSARVAPGAAVVPVAAEEVPESERVVVPPEEPLPEHLRRMRKGTDLFLSFASHSMAPFALNWIANLRRAGISTVLVGALDEKMEQICKQENVPMLPIQAQSVQSSAANLRFDYGAYKRMAALKVEFYKRILNMGFNLWACDADTGWMGNPAPFVNEYPMQHVDMMTTTDCIDVEGDTKGGCWHVDHNTGLVYMRARPIVIEFLTAWKLKVQTTRDIMIRDQAALNLLMREQFRSKTWTAPPDPEGGSAVRPIYLAWNDKLKIARLPLRYFANGHTFFVQRMYAKEAHPPPFVVHMTYQYGDASNFPFGKRQRMREGRVWQVDPPSYFNDGKYLAIAPEAAALPIDYLPGSITTAEAADRFNREDAHMRRVLRDALALAIALNRTLVMPRMLCYCDNIWKEMKHCRVGGAFGMTLPFDCPADHIINLPRWFAPDVPIAFREPGFLSDPRLSPTIKKSWVRVSTPPMTANEATALLKPYADHRVIELSAAKDRFCGFEDGSKASLFERLAPALIPYSRHFCYEDGGYDAGRVVPFYSPCCSGRPGHFFPCKHLVPPPEFYGRASNPPPFCAGRQAGRVEAMPPPSDYPDLSPNPRSRQFHAVQDEFRAGFKRKAAGGDGTAA